MSESLLRCTLKKSASVLEKYVKYGSYAIVAVTAIAITGYGLIVAYTAIAQPMTDGVNGIIGLALGIPWYWYAGICAIAAILVYSLLLCIARDLTEEDWESTAAQFALLALLAIAIIALPTILAIAIIALPTILAIALADHAALLAIALADHAALLAIALDDDKTSCWYYVFCFPGAAWHHYCKKAKQVQP